MPLERRAYSPEEVGEMLGVRAEYIRSLIRRGVLPAVRLSRRRILIPVEALADLLDLEGTERDVKPFLAGRS